MARRPRRRAPRAAGAAEALQALARSGSADGRTVDTAGRRVERPIQAAVWAANQINCNNFDRKMLANV